MITVVSQSTAERNEEIKQLFEKIKPYLDNGYIYSKAIKEVTDIKGHVYYKNGWYKDLLNYGETQGYPREQYTGKRKRKHNEEVLE